MSNEQKQLIRENLEANFLDGDKINDCGGVTFSVDGALDIAEYFYDLAIKETEERMVREIEELPVFQMAWTREGIIDFLTARGLLPKITE